MFYEMSCAQVEEDEQTEKFKCKDGEEINAKKVCDFIKDCADGEDEAKCADCDFEDEKWPRCQYKDISTDGYQWRYVKAYQSIKGPYIDNTYKTPEGSYLQAVYDRNADGQKASLWLQQELKPCSSTCTLEFYYHKFGQTPDLRVYFTINEFSKTDLLLLRGDSGNFWNYARIPIGRISAPFRLGFDSLQYWSENYVNDVALDDIRLINCQFTQIRPVCPAQYFTCKRKSCIPESQVCDLIDDCGDNSDEASCVNYTMCSFEEGFCDWKIEMNSNSTFKWKLGKGRDSHTTNNAPSRDHTLGLLTGQYAYIDVKSRNPGQRARLFSPVFRPTDKSSCELRIFYFIDGKDTGSLDVYMRTEVDGARDLLFSQSRPVGSYWERAYLKLNSSSSFQIIVEGVVGKGRYGDIAIDGKY